MRYIDKSKNRQEGLRITSDFLDNHCDAGNRRHDDIRYSDKEAGTNDVFREADNRKYYRGMVNLLLTNQDRYCCYCLRRLKTAQNPNSSDALITVEHIIPRSFTSGDDTACYQELLDNNVVMTDRYVAPDYVQVRNKHPHKVAYDNLVLSCNGTFPVKETGEHNRSNICCNVARHTADAFPLYLHNDCKDYIEYLKNGDIQAVLGTDLEERVTELINNVKLGCLPLKRIRRLWYALRNEDWQKISECDSSEDKRRELISRHLFDGSSDVEEDSDIIDEYTRQNNWETFRLYSIFHDIMKTAFPS